MDFSKIATCLLRQFDTKPASTLFINGAPGTGKSFLLETLIDYLPKEISNVKVLGPIKNTCTSSIERQILESLYELSYLPSMPDQNDVDDLNSTWYWLKKNFRLSIRQLFVFLIDLGDIAWDEYDEIRIIFSGMRYLEYLWDSRQIRIAIVIAGFWDHPGLKEYYGKIKLSFPYTIGNNYFIWEGISIDESANLVKEINPIFQQKKGFIHLLHELSG